ncbi:non-canonical purine NTP pyrophosphatase [Oceanidesulfovibrio indonesiensis]|uniref:dITP/XTP pyrophosphatase n=1 Tax=Oceanidesulfovibrio indonesiensis TaxID=54767 RepID=A0A7M3MBK2_9BACT|nr:XTP/dITP diphosphatase [Oceanidesulfovibrio indonesiensis]TVM15538.1 non-canonical purine NTP pyrophosphatase [Oceanidesulfovibrio indonesiensis]
MTKLVLATRNAGKIAELTRLLEPHGVEVLGLDRFPEIGEIPEEGETFAENALTKALTVARATGLIAVADDSGLAVDALGGAPGVYSARYAQPEDVPGGDSMSQDERNNAKLLAALQDVPPQERTARFVCCMAAAAPNEETLVAERFWKGRIAEAPAGDNGFGYDPLFHVPDAGCTSAQLAPEEKNRRSHRGQALEALLQEWPGFLERALTKK